MKFNKLVICVSLGSLLYAHEAVSQGIAALAIPIIAAIEATSATTLMADAALIGTAGFTASVIDSKTNLLGKTVNAVKLFAKGQSDTAAPDLVLDVDPKSIPSTAPSNWAFDKGSGLTWDPSVNSGPVVGNSTAGKTLCHVDFNFCGEVSGSTGTPSQIASWITSTAQACSNSSSWGASAMGSDTSDNCSFTVSYVGVVQGTLIQAAATGSGGNAKPPIDATKPPMWPSDGLCTMSRSGNGFAFNMQDPDCFQGGNNANSPNPLPPNMSSTGNQIKATNGTSTTTVTINPDGSIKVTSSNPNSAGTATVATNVDLSAPVAGATSPTVVVTGQSTSTYPGTGTQTSTTPISTVGTVDPTTGLPTSSSGGSTTNPAVVADLDAIKAATEAQKADLDKIADETQPVSPGLPAIPSFYTRVYPNGIVSVWDKYSAQFQNTPLIQLLNRFVPSWGAGTCPVIRVDLNLSSWANFGEADMSPPCFVWDACAMIMMLSAVMCCRRIIFGG